MNYATKIKKWVGFGLVGLLFLGISFTAQGEDIGSCERWGKMLVEDVDGYEVEKIVFLCDMDVVDPSADPNIGYDSPSYDGGASSGNSPDKGTQGGDYAHKATESGER